MCMLISLWKKRTTENKFQCKILMFWLAINWRLDLPPMTMFSLPPTIVRFVCVCGACVWRGLGWRYKDLLYSIMRSLWCTLIDSHFLFNRLLTFAGIPLLLNFGRSSCDLAQLSFFPFTKEKNLGDRLAISVDKSTTISYPRVGEQRWIWTSSLPISINILHYSKNNPLQAVKSLANARMANRL